MKQNNFSYLLAALLVLLLGIPLANDFTLASGPLIRSLAFSLLLMIGIWSLKGGGRYFTVGMTFVVAGVALDFLALNIDSAFLYFGSSAAIFGFLMVAIAYSLKWVVFSTEITLNRLVGAVCVYLLLGTIWAVAYSLIDAVSPGSFSGLSPQAGGGRYAEWFYFSFVTMASLGYGDILPVLGTARTLAYMQVVFGQLYIAILVAGLVSAYITNKRHD